MSSTEKIKDPIASDWVPITLKGRSIQPQTDRPWDCVPAWDITAVYAKPDEWLVLPSLLAEEAKRIGKKVPERIGIFWDRHIDRRHHLTYSRASRDGPRATGRTIGELSREWDVLIRQRDLVLAGAGLTSRGNPRDVARALADYFAYHVFEERPMCTTFPSAPRALDHAIEGLLHKSHCVGCATAYEAMMDSCDFDVRTIGCGAHRVAEVRVEDRWHLVDSVARHAKNRGLDCYFKSSYHDTYLDPMGDHGDHLTADFRLGLYTRPNPQFHFHDGMWGGPRTLRWATSCAHALYPDNGRWGFKATTHLPILRRAGGFYWPTVHSSDVAVMEEIRLESIPRPMADQGPSRDYFYHPFRKGQILRESFWLDDLSNLQKIQLGFTFAGSRDSDFSDSMGQNLILRAGNFQKSLFELGAWPPGDPVRGDVPSGEVLVSTVDLPTDCFQGCAANVIELHQNASSLFHIPCVAAVLAPCIPPLHLGD